jgi:hypothetical protein
MAKKSKPKKHYYSGITIYRKYGVAHNINGPAYIDENLGIVKYFVFGKLHRINGPAVIRKDGTVDRYLWYLNGKNYSFSEWCKHTTLDRNKLVMVILQYG